MINNQEVNKIKGQAYRDAAIAIESMKEVNIDGIEVEMNPQTQLAASIMLLHAMADKLLIGEDF